VRVSHRIGLKIVEIADPIFYPGRPHPCAVRFVYISAYIREYRTDNKASLKQVVALDDRRQWKVVTVALRLDLLSSQNWESLARNLKPLKGPLLRICTIKRFIAVLARRAPQARMDAGGEPGLVAIFPTVDNLLGLLESRVEVTALDPAPPMGDPKRAKSPKFP
jgi:hypothetical protein